MLLHHDLVDGAFDLGRGELFGVGVEQRKLAATDVELVVVALDAAEAVDDPLGRFDGAERRVGHAEDAAGDADRRLLQVAEHQFEPPHDRSGWARPAANPTRR